MLEVVENWGLGMSCDIVGNYSFCSWLLQVAAAPSVGARWLSRLVWSPQRRRVLDWTMVRLILVWMKIAMLEYVRLHFFASNHATRCSAVLSSLEAMPLTEG